MDSIDEIIKNVMQNEIAEPIEFKQAILTAFETKTNHPIYSKVIKIITAITTFIALTIGVVFAKDIYQWVYHIWNPETTSKGIIHMAEQGYLYNTEMEYIESNGSKFKIDNVIMDDYNFNMIFSIEWNENIENISQISIPDLLISDEDNHIIFCDYENVKGYEEFCKKNNIEYSNKNMHNNCTDKGYSIELVEKNEKNIKFIYKMYSSQYPNSKKLNISLKTITMKNGKDTYDLNGNWNIEVNLPEEMYRRQMMVYDSKDGSDKDNNIVIEEAKGSYTEMHITLVIKQLREPYERTKEGLEKLLESLTPADEIIATLENERGEIFKQALANTDGSGGSSPHPNGDVTFYLRFAITKEDYTDTLKLHLTTNNKTVTVNLNR